MGIVKKIITFSAFIACSTVCVMPNSIYAAEKKENKESKLFLPAK